MYVCIDGRSTDVFLHAPADTQDQVIKMMSVIQVFRRLFPFSVAFNIFKIIAFTKSQRLFMLNTYFECKNYTAIARRFHA